MSAELDALRDYLDDLRRRAREGDDLTRLDAAILENPEPMVRISLMDQRRRVAERRRELERAFVEHAAGWSAAARVSRAAFLSEGVPGDVLDRAGIRD